MRYELAFMLPKTNKEIANLLGLCLLLCGGGHQADGTVLVLRGRVLLPLLNALGLDSYPIPPLVFINGVFLALILLR